MKDTRIRSLLIGVVLIQLSGCTVSPTPYTQEEQLSNLEHDITDLNLIRPSLPEQLTLDHAIARAIKYNLDFQIKVLEQDIAYTDMHLSNLNMLPNLIGNLGYVDRNKPNAILSPISNQVSTSEDTIRRLANLSFSWNILDFGVSYYESKQKSDQVLIAEQTKRKLIQKLTKDTRNAYWRAIAANNYFASAKGFDKEVLESIKNSEEAEKKKLMTVLDASSFRRDLLLIYNQISTLNFELARYQPELMSLIRAPSQTKTTLKSLPHSSLNITDSLPERIDKLERLALYYRPELQEENYRKRISLNEVNKARLRLLPGFEVNYGSYHDSNSFLVNNNWNQFSSSLSYNIFKVFSNAKNLNLAQQQKELSEVRKVALSMAIVTQVDIAKLRYNYAKEILDINEKILSNEDNIYKTITTKQEYFESKFMKVKSRGSFILAKIKRDIAYADYQSAAAELIDSVGLDPIYDTNYVNLPLDELTTMIRYVNKDIALKNNQLEELLTKVPELS